MRRRVEGLRNLIQQKPPVFTDPIFTDKLADAALCMKWSPVGMYLAIGVACGDLVLLKYQKKRTATITVPEAHKNGIHALEWAPVSCCLGGEVILATGGQDGKIRVWFLNTANVVDSLPELSDKFQIECGSSHSWIQSIAWLETYPYSFAVACKKQILICSALDGTILRSLPDACSSTINHLSFDPRLSKLMACSYGAVYLFDVGESCDLASHPFESQQLMEKGLMLFAVSTSYVQSPEDSSVIFAGMQDEIAMVWIVERAKSSVKILQKLKLRGFASKVTEISIDSVHGRYVACSGSPVVIVWDSGSEQADIEDGCMEESVCVGIREAVKCVKFRPYGNVQNSNNQNNLVVAASREGTVMAWDLTDTPISNQQGTRMFVPNCAFQGPAEAISLEWSRQGKVFACTFVDGTVVLFEC